MNFDALFNNDNWLNMHVQGSHSQSQAPFIKPSARLIQHCHIPQSPSSNLGVTPGHVALYLPYLHFDTYKNVLRRKRLIAQRLSQGRAIPVPVEVAGLESLELQVIWEFFAHSLPIHYRRTLDQFGYPSLRDTTARDNDQMLYKLTKEDVTEMPHQGNTNRLKASVGPRSSRIRKGFSAVSGGGSQPLGKGCDRIEDARNGNLLMVDQLWLWVAGDCKFAGHN